MEFDTISALSLSTQATCLRKFLHHFEATRGKLHFSKGVYVCGPPGCGKSTFVRQVLESEGYDVVSYDTSHTRNRGAIDALAAAGTGSQNVLSLLQGSRQPIAIMMDDVDGMNTGDKGGINNMIKLVRAKRTKRQRSEPTASSPIICIGGRQMDKKLVELQSATACTITLPKPDKHVISAITKNAFPAISEPSLESIVQYADGDMWRMHAAYKLYKNCGGQGCVQALAQLHDFGRSETTTKTITSFLLNSHPSYNEHDAVMSETDRTSVGLLLHENIIDVLSEKDEPLYLECLDNFCFGDRIDRATFQKQIWSFNEMSSLIKTMYNVHLFHSKRQTPAPYTDTPRFTKVLTKYSTEYNNSVFLSGMCQKLGMDTKDVEAYFSGFPEDQRHELIHHLESYDVSKLDINRMFKLLAY